MAGTFDSGADMYQLTLRICLILFVTGIVCGGIYEIIRRKRRAKRVVPVSEGEPKPYLFLIILHVSCVFLHIDFKC